MGFFRKLVGRQKSQRVVVISLDGAPFTFVQKLLAQGEMPNLAAIVGEGNLSRMNSVWPTVSSVAWSSFMTGHNPGKHNIYGFLDRKPGTYKTFIPNSRTMRSVTLWEIMSQAGKRVVVINVPVTYPPRPVNGVLVAGFLSPSLEKCAYPPAVVPRLKELGYVIDADPWACRQSKDKVLAEVNAALDSRRRALVHFMENEPWDFFMVHVMETDRLHHFLWEQMEQEHPVYAPAFLEVYRRIDDLLGEVRRKLPDDTTLIVMSDHGFCTLKKEVYVNHWLAGQGWLRFQKNPPQSLLDIHPESKAYSLDPGRVFINLRGREPGGCVEPGAEYEDLREQIAVAARQLTDPDSGERIVDRVLRREDIYHGPYFDQAADLVLAPAKGYDLKGALAKDTLVFKGDELVGSHTYDDAMLCITGHPVTHTDFSIVDVMPTILSLMDVPVPPDVDGVSLI